MPEPTWPLPPSFVTEVEALKAELAAVAPRMLGIAARFSALQDRFNSTLMPPGTDEALWQAAWRESGAAQLHDFLAQLTEEMIDHFGLAGVY